MPTIIDDNNGSVPFLNPNEFTDGEEVVFVSEGKYVTDRYANNRLQMDVQFSNNAIRKVTINKTSQKNLITVYGPETNSWVGCKARITRTKMPVAGNWKQVVILYPAE